MIHALTEYLRVRKMKLYRAFIDFQKAFDSVWRVGLWHKLIKSNVAGKILTIIKNLYANIKSCNSFNNKSSDFLECKNGLRQGENLLPVLFLCFSMILKTSSLTMTSSVSHFWWVHTYLKLVVLLNTVLVAESEEELQQLLYEFQAYCTTWKLRVILINQKL